MKIEHAIELLSDSAFKSVTTHDHNFKDALKLGIESLRFIQLARLASPGSVPTQLHGETVETASP